MRSFISIILLGSMSEKVAGDLLAQGMSCQIQYRGFSWTGSCVDNSAVDFTHPFVKAPECAQVSPHAWCAVAEIPCEYRLQGGVCMNPVSSCSSTTFTSAQFKYYMDKNNQLVYLCPGGLTCCINGRIAGPDSKPSLPVQSFSGPFDSSLMPADSSSDDIQWAFDDSNSDTADFLAEPSYDETFDAFLDPIGSNPDLLSDSTNDWASIFNDPNEGADFALQEQPLDNEDAFLNAMAPNSYLNDPSDELASIFDDSSPGTDFTIPEQSSG